MTSLPFVPSNPIVDAIKALYGVATSVNTFIDEHIAKLKAHENETINTTMTCGAIGAIYYGWQALSEEEKNAILARLTAAFEVGVELIKSMISFVISSLGSILSKEKLAEFKNFVASAAENFGKTLADITRDIKDKFFHVMDWVGNAWKEASTSVQEGAERTKDSVKEKFEKMTKKSE